MTTQAKLRAVDADAHVLESERTWEYMDADDQKYGHTDTSSEVDAIEVFRNLDTISEEQKHKVLVDNPVAPYRL